MERKKRFWAGVGGDAVRSLGCFGKTTGAFLLFNSALGERDPYGMTYGDIAQMMLAYKLNYLLQL